MKQIPLGEVPTYLEADYQVYDIRAIEALEEGSIAQSIYLPQDAAIEQIVHIISQPAYSILCTDNPEKIPSVLQDIIGLYFVLPPKEAFPPNLPFDILITVDEEEFILDIKHDKKAVIIDVRDNNQYNERHIVSSISIPLTSLQNAEEDIILLDKIYVVGTTNSEALCATSIIRNMGIVNVRAVLLNPDRWEEAGLPLSRTKK